ncbi:hypothetical protein [Microbaculum marinisediminis]|uniref:Transposase n=1 Tax=Microbaculum marinisediminis TaxID=2931392 RepID=A0AAW5R043_9HYPH|nr:hypothetical protein [Microbaculum sp. A6E488]MCT8972061.1 hypothetical protein [Microbaculum sp. A6E488]
MTGIDGTGHHTAICVQMEGESRPLVLVATQMPAFFRSIATPQPEGYKSPKSTRSRTP